MTAAIALLAVQGVSQARAQTSDLCTTLEARLVQIERSAQGGASNYQRYDAPIAQQKDQIDRATAEARRAGCIGGFLIFKPRPDPKCGQLMATINRMQGNLQRLMATRGNAGGDPYSIARERGEIMRQLAFNRCGPSYATNDNQMFQRRPGGLLGALFGGPQLRTYDDESFMPDTQVGTYRTLCVRTCDGYYFPISFSTVPAKFNDDAATCQSMCPGAEAVLYTYRNPGQEPAQAVSLAGEPYTSLPTAFKYRQSYDKTCTCHSATAVAAPNFTDFSNGETIITDPSMQAGLDQGLAQGGLAPMTVTPVPMPRLRPALGEDPETIANRAGDFVPGPLTPPAPAETVTTTAATASTGDTARKVRIVGPAYYYGQQADQPAGP
jgi:hypothetical protein